MIQKMWNIYTVIDFFSIKLYSHWEKFHKVKICEDVNLTKFSNLQR